MLNVWPLLTALFALSSVQFPIGPGSEGPLGAMAGMDPMHMNGGESFFNVLKSK